MLEESEARVCLVIPTLGTRLGFLSEAITSIRNQDQKVDLVVVSPASATAARELAEAAEARWIEDPGTLPGAINVGILSNQFSDFVGWLGDDDLLTPGSLTITVRALTKLPDAVLAYGSCRYIDAAGHELWVSRAGNLAQKVLSWGPQLIPQPGMLVRRSAWNAVGGLDASFRFAFDFDLLLKLRAQGTFVCTPEIVSAFRWHADSMTVADRSMNLEESERARRRYLTPRQRRWAWIWEAPVRSATRVAVHAVNRRARKARRQGNRP